MNLITRFAALCHFSMLSVLASISVNAQTAETEIVDHTVPGRRAWDDAMVKKLEVMIKEKKLLESKECRKQLKVNRPKAITLPEPKTKALSTEELAELGRNSHLKVGYCYLCEKCDNWHFNLAGGYAISPNHVVTCDHVIDTSITMREGYLVVIDAKDQIYPVIAINASSDKMDAAIIEIEGDGLQPLALQPEIRQGSAVYCFSDPMKHDGYFSDGVINRFFWQRSPGKDPLEKLDQLRFLRFNCSTDWAPGSSGSAVFDSCGNAVGHVSEIASLSKGKGAPAFVTLHKGIPAKGVKALAQAMTNPEDIAQLNATEAKENRPSNQPASKLKKQAADQKSTEKKE
jgi:hypothetical protein